MTFLFLIWTADAHRPAVYWVPGANPADAMLRLLASEPGVMNNVAKIEIFS